MRSVPRFYGKWMAREGHLNKQTDELHEHDKVMIE